MKLTVGDLKAGLMDPSLLDLPEGPAGHMLNMLAAFVTHDSPADDAEFALIRCDCNDCTARRIDSVAIVTLN